MKRIVIVDVSSLSLDNKFKRLDFYKLNPNSYTSDRILFDSNLLIVKSPTHFRCIKNRWDETADDEKIPNSLLKAYIMQYKENFSNEELIDSLI